MNDIVIIGSNAGITIRTLLAKFQSKGFNAVFTGTDRDKISQATADAGIFLMSVHDDLDEVSPMFSQVKEASVDRGVPIVVMADKLDTADVRKRYVDFASSVDVWFEREGGMDEIVDTIVGHLKNEKELKEKKNILIVDDDPTYAKMVREWLKDSYHISVVVNAMQAISFMTKHPTDLVLLDYEMPVISGPQVFEMMRAEPETANVPVVFLTGVGDAASVSRVLALKPAGYLLKSSSRETIKAWLVNYFYKK